MKKITLCITDKMENDMRYCNEDQCEDCSCQLGEDDCILSHIAEPYKGMTNGEVIKAVFPNADIEYRKIAVYVIISPRTNLVIFDKGWWNSLYSERSDKE